MNVTSKLNILADAAKYDASCASSSSVRKGKKGELGSTNGTGICHSFTPDGRCVSLLKILLTNYCIYDCLYCVNRLSSDVPRARFTPAEVVELTMEFYRRNYIEGLFLSSGIIKSPDYTAELLTEVGRSLRTTHQFSGYIHLKAAPGTDAVLLKEMSRWCDRISVNIELPTEENLAEIAPAKTHVQVESTMKTLKAGIDHKKAERKNPALRFAANSQSTQIIVGATSASDQQILTTADKLYNNYDLNRVYYSGYSPIPKSAAILPAKQTPMLREHRLYQADWLSRFYKFSVAELFTGDSNLDLRVDPKLSWALKNLQQFPIDPNTASKYELLRVPGLGVRGVEKILATRKFSAITLSTLQKMHLQLNKAKYFLKFNSKNYYNSYLDRQNFSDFFIKPESAQQLSLFSAAES